MRIILVVLVLLFMGLQYELWFSHDGLRMTFNMQSKIEQQQQHNQQLRARNQLAATDVADLKHGKHVIEERARNDLGMIKKNETFYRVVKK